MMIIEEHIPGIDEYYPLYLATGWNELQKLSRDEVKTAIQQSFTCVCVYNQSTLIGFGRVISDGVVYASIYDVMVREDFKRQGIGTEIVNRLIAKCKSKNIRSIHLWAAAGTVPFYKQLDFVTRPEDSPGMKYDPVSAQKDVKAHAV